MKRVSVVAAIIEDGDSILCVQRPSSKYEYVSEKWEFPGGKVEEGETQQEALAREIQEELHIAVTVGDLVLTVEHTYPDFHITMHGFRCSFAGDAKRANLVLIEHIDSKWLSAIVDALVKTQSSNS
jgi:8-oxo-dGTP diphosphatase